MPDGLRAVILAGGESARWGGYPKHLIVPEGSESLLARQVRQARSYDAEVVVIGSGPGYALGDVLVPSEHPYLLAAAVPHTVAERAVILWGDVWFTDEAIGRIFGAVGFRWFGREGPSSVTGCQHGEIFAMAFGVEDRPVFVQSVDVAERYCAPRVPMGWHAYRISDGISHTDHRVGARWVEVDDRTEDFDCPADLFAWWLTPVG